MLQQWYRMRQPYLPLKLQRWGRTQVPPLALLHAVMVKSPVRTLASKLASCLRLKALVARVRPRWVTALTRVTSLTWVAALTQLATC
jgi:hypothetical protein